MTSKKAAIEFGGEIVELSESPMPVVYFDGATSLSHMNGIIGVTLTVTGNLPSPPNSINICAAVVAHLKCNIPAARSLVAALNSALLLAQPVENESGPAN